MIELADLPAVNATLNSISLVLLVFGFVMIRKGHVTAHKRAMVTAFGVSVLFLASYLTYRFSVGDKKFGGQGWVRLVYFTVLIPHVILAATVPVLASRLLYLGFRGRIAAHKRLARIAWPIWVFVSISGVFVYFMLFKLYPTPATAAG